MAQAHTDNEVLRARLKTAVFWPLFEDNITKEEEKEDVDSEDEAIKRNPNYIRDGARYSKAMEKEIKKELSKKYEFPNFNMLLYSSEHLMTYASSQDINEDNREDLYDLVDKAHKLEPKPEPELTFT